ncbi:MAG: hypothetical protein HKP53_06725 [Eudoraea sp.]|nr:hypothetical protein [Eudoraea sp.]
MKTFLRAPKPSNTIRLFIIFFMGTWLGNAQISTTTGLEIYKPETEIQPDIYWQVKAYRPDAQLLNVKVINKDGAYHDVKAIQNSEETSILDVKAFVNGERLPIKLIVKDNDRYYPAKAIASDGTLVDFKAITEKGEILPIKGVSKSGNIVHLRAIAQDNVFYNIVAISPEGEVNNVKGIKMLNTTVETVINGVSIFAHIKAIPQK